MWSVEFQAWFKLWGLGFGNPEPALNSTTRGLRGWGLGSEGFMVYKLLFTVYRLWFRINGLWFRIEDSGQVQSRIWGFEG